MKNEINDEIILKYIDKADMYIDSFCGLAEKFLSNYCYTEGLVNLLLKTEYVKFGKDEKIDYDGTLSYDFDYFVLAKSIKTLKAIEILLSEDDLCYSEDIMSLCRSLLENHIWGRYFRDNIDKNGVVNNEIILSVMQGPISDQYVTSIISKVDGEYSKGEITAKTTKTNQIKSKQENRMYIERLYRFLSGFVHVNYGIVSHYIDGGQYTIRKKKHLLVARVIALFCFEKVYESIVNISGEDFETKEEAKRYWDISYDVLEFLEETLHLLELCYSRETVISRDELTILRYCGRIENKVKIDLFTERRKMFSGMKSSLVDDTLSDLKKEKYRNGKYKRVYNY